MYHQILEVISFTKIGLIVKLLCRITLDCTGGSNKLVLKSSPDFRFSHLCVSGLVKIKDANDIEEKLNEVERLLKNAINMPCKVSHSIITVY